MAEHSPGPTRAGFVAVVGRPNVGKSTLVNALVGTKVSITTPKPQTTRHRIMGVRTQGDLQAVFVDTPGLHLRRGSTFHSMLNRTASDSLVDVDLVLFVVKAMRFTAEDEAVLERLKNTSAPVALVVNKVDLVKHREDLLPFLADLGGRFDFAFVLPGSASKGSNLDALWSEVEARLPESPFFFDPDQKTDRSTQLHAAEVVREQLFMALEQELPYALTVEIERDAYNADGQREIDAVIWVAEQRHKGIVIGKQGAKLKQVGSAARRQLKRHFGESVHLTLWCRVKSGWADDARALAALGYDMPER